MSSTERVTVTLRAELLTGIDEFERNRSRFITEAVEHELVRRRRERLLQSLQMPHPESRELDDAEFLDWAAHLPDADDGLLDQTAGKAVRWVEGEGWLEVVG
jgi:hypothetical protein